MNMLQMSEAMRDGRSISLKSQTQLIIALSIPAILEQLVMTLMSYIDTAMVGSLGPGATAAIGVVASSIWLMNGLTSAIAVGFSVQIAQYLGAGRDGDSRNVLCQSILFNVLFGVVMAAAAIGIGQVLPELLGSDPEIAPAARSYFCTVAFFFPFSMASALYSSILRCSGNILLPSIMNVGMCVFDVIFNFIFIYPPRDIGGFHVWGAGRGSGHRTCPGLRGRDPSSGHHLPQGTAPLPGKRDLALHKAVHEQHAAPVHAHGSGAHGPFPGPDRHDLCGGRNGHRGRGLQLRSCPD